MSRSGYQCDVDQWDGIRWRGQVVSATRGKRGQVEPEDLTDAIMAILEKGLADD